MTWKSHLYNCVYVGYFFPPFSSVTTWHRRIVAQKSKQNSTRSVCVALLTSGQGYAWAVSGAIVCCTPSRLHVSYNFDEIHIKIPSRLCHTHISHKTTDVFVNFQIDNLCNYLTFQKLIDQVIYAISSFYAISSSFFPDSTLCAASVIPKKSNWIHQVWTVSTASEWDTLILWILGVCSLLNMFTRWYR